ncbi:MAG TPA: heavy metal translocating P-type ATPase [Nanoarchaeota archaeon]|nr:heavy metal translocating P-type ATPase [Nanoarchaeota archaeon]
MAVDPICGMQVDEKTATITKTVNGKKYYFCSSNCLAAFEAPEKDFANLKRILMLSAGLTIVILLLMFAVNVPYENYILLVLASIVQFYPGFRYYKGMLDAFKAKTANMDTLVAIGTSAAWAYSVYGLFTNSNSLYFDTSALIITFILLGKFLEDVAKGRASQALKKLMDLTPRTAIVVRAQGEVEIPVSEIKTEDICIVKPGEKIPTDGIVIFGHSEVDESIITGESMPVSKSIGDKVIGGTINKSELLKIKATKVGQDTLLAQIVELVSSAHMSKVPVQRLADQVSGYFVPAVIFVAIASGFYWHYASANITFVLTVAVSVLIIACPCALGLATPTALLLGIGKGAEAGILIRNGEALESAGKVDTVIFDKTGTITEGRPEVTGLHLMQIEKPLFLKYAVIAEKGSSHPIAKAIVDYSDIRLEKHKEAESHQIIPGKGVKAKFQNAYILVGNKALLKDENISIDGFEYEIHDLEMQGQTVVLVAYNHKFIGAVSIADKLKKEARSAVESLKKQGIDVYMITGDNEKVASHIAREAGIINIFAQALPQDKLKKIKELQSHGAVVAMVGDGVNDGPALAAADVGIAVGAGTDIAKESGGIVLIKSDMRDVISAIKLSKYIMAKVKQNLFWAFFYNVAAIPIAAGVLYPITGTLLNPAIAALAMAFSSVSVVANSLLIKNFKVRK